MDEVRKLNGIGDRYNFIDSLSHSDRAELFRGLSKADKSKYDSYLTRTVEARRKASNEQRLELITSIKEKVRAHKEKVRAEREQRLIESRLGNAKNIIDVVQVLMEDIESLSERDKWWVEAMYSTRSNQVNTYAGFSKRQQQVFWTIYKTYFS